MEIGMHTVLCFSAGVPGYYRQRGYRYRLWYKFKKMYGASRIPGAHQDIAAGFRTIQFHLVMADSLL